MEGGSENRRVYTRDFLLKFAHEFTKPPDNWDSVANSELNKEARDTREISDGRANAGYPRQLAPSRESNVEQGWGRSSALWHKSPGPPHIHSRLVDGAVPLQPPAERRAVGRAGGHPRAEEAGGSLRPIGRPPGLPDREAEEGQVEQPPADKRLPANGRGERWEAYGAREKPREPGERREGWGRGAAPPGREGERAGGNWRTAKVGGDPREPGKAWAGRGRGSSDGDRDREPHKAPGRGGPDWQDNEEENALRRTASAAQDFEAERKRMQEQWRNKAQKVEQVDEFNGLMDDDNDDKFEDAEPAVKAAAAKGDAGVEARVIDDAAKPAAKEEAQPAASRKPPPGFDVMTKKAEEGSGKLELEKQESRFARWFSMDEALSSIAQADANSNGLTKKSQPETGVATSAGEAASTSAPAAAVAAAGVALPSASADLWAVKASVGTSNTLGSAASFMSAQGSGQLGIWGAPPETHTSTAAQSSLAGLFANAAPVPPAPPPAPPAASQPQPLAGLFGALQQPATAASAAPIAHASSIEALFGAAAGKPAAPLPASQSLAAFFGGGQAVSVGPPAPPSQPPLSALYGGPPALHAASLASPQAPSASLFPPSTVAPGLSMLRGPQPSPRGMPLPHSAGVSAAYPTAAHGPGLSRPMADVAPPPIPAAPQLSAGLEPQSSFGFPHLQSTYPASSRNIFPAPQPSGRMRTVDEIENSMRGPDARAAAGGQPPLPARGGGLEAFLAAAQPRMDPFKADPLQPPSARSLLNMLQGPLDAPQAPGVWGGNQQPLANNQPLPGNYAGGRQQPPFASSGAMGQSILPGPGPRSVLPDRTDVLKQMQMAQAQAARGLDGFQRGTGMAPQLQDRAPWLPGTTDLNMQQQRTEQQLFRDSARRPSLEQEVFARQGMQPLNPLSAYGLDNFGRQQQAYGRGMNPPMPSGYMQPGNLMNGAHAPRPAQVGMGGYPVQGVRNSRNPLVPTAKKPADFENMDRFFHSFNAANARAPPVSAPPSFVPLENTNTMTLEELERRLNVR